MRTQRRKMTPLMLSSDLFDNVKGPVVLFGAALFFAIFDAMLNYLSHNIPSGEIILSRFLVVIIISSTPYLSSRPDTLYSQS
jgi:hypothetical protein